MNNKFHIKNHYFFIANGVLFRAALVSNALLLNTSIAMKNLETYFISNWPLVSFGEAP